MTCSNSVTAVLSAAASSRKAYVCLCGDDAEACACIELELNHQGRVLDAHYGGLLLRLSRAYECCGPDTARRGVKPWLNRWPIWPSCFPNDNALLLIYMPHDPGDPQAPLPNVARTAMLLFGKSKGML